jgi:DNA-directed RNA polymerase subunit RPC12/RpoP
MTRVGRELACTRCQEVVIVIEPVEYIDPERYVCGNCMRPVEGQLEMVDGHRVEERAYDPDLAAFPEGF